MEEKFSAKRGRSAYLPIMIGFIILLSPVIAIYLDPAEQLNFSFSWAALFPLSLFIFFAYVLISSSLKMFTSYSVTSEGIRIFQPPFHARFFSIKEIEELKYLSAADTRKIIEASILEQNSYGESADIIGYIRMLRKKSPLTGISPLLPVLKLQL